MELVVDQAAIAELLWEPEEWLIRITDAIEADAQRYAPVDTGALQASIRSDVSTLAAGYTRVYVGESGFDEHKAPNGVLQYWAAQEYGARAHEIRPRGPGYPLRFYWAKVGRMVAFWRVNHPGNAPQPFMRPALYQDR